MGTPWLEELEVRQLLSGAGGGPSLCLPQAPSISQQRLAAPSSVHGPSGDQVNPGGGIHALDMGAHVGQARARDSRNVGWNETASVNPHWRAGESASLGDASSGGAGRGEAGLFTADSAESPDTETTTALSPGPLWDGRTCVVRAVEAVFAERGGAVTGSLVSQAVLVVIPALAAAQVPSPSLARASEYVSAPDLSPPRAPVKLPSLAEGGTQQAPDMPLLADMLSSLPYGNLGILHAGIRDFLDRLPGVGNQLLAQTDECRLTVWLIAGAAAAAACEMARRQLRKPEIDSTERDQLLWLPTEEERAR